VNTIDLLSFLLAKIRAILAPSTDLPLSTVGEVAIKSTVNFCGDNSLDLARTEVNRLWDSSSNHHCIAITGPIVKKKAVTILTMFVTALCKFS
jgi:hypothetical protein